MKDNEILTIDKLDEEVTNKLEVIQNDIPNDVQSDLLKVKYYEFFKTKVANDSKLETAIKFNLSKFALYVTDAITLGLQPGSEFNLLPFNGQLQSHYHYKALVKLMLKYSIIPLKQIKGGVVRSNDKYIVENEKLKHNYDPFQSVAERGKIIGAYAEFIHEDNTSDFHFISQQEIENVKKEIKGSDNKFSAWVKYPEKMAIKTVIRKAQNLYPLDFGNTTINQANDRINELDSPFKKIELVQQEENNLTPPPPLPRHEHDKIAEEVEVIEVETKKDTKSKYEPFEIIKDYRQELTEITKTMDIEEKKKLAKRFNITSTSTNQDYFNIVCKLDLESRGN